MKKGRIISWDSEIRQALAGANDIAVVGLSPKPERDSHRVGKYLKEVGYRIIPVRPAQKEILGEKAYRSLDDIQGPVDIVNVFRASDQVMPHAHEAVRLGARVFWMQLGIENGEAAELLIENGIDVVMNRCIKVDYERLFG